MPNLPLIHLPAIFDTIVMALALVTIVALFVRMHNLEDEASHLEECVGEHVGMPVSRAEHFRPVGSSTSGYYCTVCWRGCGPPRDG